jgi:murein DD-endopeptidase MepM/ murein hydrolase activator NlpD
VPALVSLRLQLEAELEADSARFGDLPRALAERRTETLRALSARIAALTPRPTRADPSRFLWPTSPVAVTSAWGDRLHPIFGEVRFHAGVDLGAELAQEIRAAGPGTVVFAGWNGAHGKQLELQHDAHLTTRYSHLMTLLVGVGKKVQRGEVIGLAGQTGQATGPHLHFELRVDGESVDPESRLPPPQEPAHARSER